MAEETKEEKLARLDIGFTDLEASMATLFILDRIEERQRRHSKMLLSLIEKIAPELVDSADFKYLSSEDWLVDRLLRIQEDVDLVKRLIKKDK